MAHQAKKLVCSHDSALYLPESPQAAQIIPTYVSPLYVGSISDVELTRICEFLTKLKDKPGISIIANRGFTVKDMLERLGIRLNIRTPIDGGSAATSI